MVSFDLSRRGNHFKEVTLKIDYQVKTENYLEVFSHSFQILSFKFNRSFM